MKKKALILLFVPKSHKTNGEKKTFRQLVKNVYCCKNKTKLTLGHQVSLWWRKTNIPLFLFFFHSYITPFFNIIPHSNCHPLLSCPLSPTILALLSSDGGMGQSQDDSIVGTKQCRHSVAIMPIPGNLSSSSPDLLQPATSILDFSNPAGKITCWLCEIKGFLYRCTVEVYSYAAVFVCLLRFQMLLMHVCR